MASLKQDIEEIRQLQSCGNRNWKGINPIYGARMRAQNRFKSGLEIAKYCAKIMRKDMAEYDLDVSRYTQSLGCWHGFIGQQKLIAIKKHLNSTDKCYLYLSGWMIAALRSEFGPLPDQSMHEKTSVASLIGELYTFLRQADARVLGELFASYDSALASKNDALASEIQSRIDNFETHVVPIIADIDAGFGNEEATYLLAKQMIEAGACCIQLENQVSDAKQCGHQDGKVTVPHEDFLSKINAVRYAFIELGVDDGVIVARTDSLGASLTQKIPVSHDPGDLAHQYNRFLKTTPVNSLEDVSEGETVIKLDGKLVKPERLANGLYRFKDGTGKQRSILDCITSLQNGADLLWIETEKPHIGQIKEMVDEVRAVIPNAKLVYNNSPSFNWTLNFRQQIFDDWASEGQDMGAYDRDDLMSEKYDGSPLAIEADQKIRTFQSDASEHAGIFHHLITLPTYHTAALSTDNLAKGYFGEEGMLAYVAEVQRKEIRQGIACVKHQAMAGSNMGDDHKEYFSGDQALKASGKDNTMNQF
ncbi:MAG: isocitrate lyase [Porticoccaceae bacterium]|nr:isocitrate lyase [Porticoccaceae bacterium]